MEEWLVTFLAAGLAEDLFWTLTPRKFFIYAKAIRQRKDEEHDTAVSIAYLNAALQRSKKMPKLESLLNRKPKKPAVNPEYANALLIAQLQDVSAKLKPIDWESEYAATEGPL